MASQFQGVQLVCATLKDRTEKVQGRNDQQQQGHEQALRLKKPRSPAEYILILSDLNTL
jgi:hypothetical protein